MAVLLFTQFAADEVIGRPHCRRVDDLCQRFHQVGVAREMARFHHRGHHGQVLFCQLFALGQCSDAVSDLQSRIPEAGDKLLQLARGVRVWRFSSEQEQVDIRLREQLASSVTPDGNQRSCRVLSHGFHPEPGEHRVDHVAGLPKERRNRLAGREVLGQCFSCCPQKTPGCQSRLGVLR